MQRLFYLGDRLYPNSEPCRDTFPLKFQEMYAMNNSLRRSTIHVQTETYSFEISGNVCIVTILLRDRLYMYRQTYSLLKFQEMCVVTISLRGRLYCKVQLETYSLLNLMKCMQTASLREYKLPHGFRTTGYIFKKGETGNVFVCPYRLFHSGIDYMYIAMYSQ